MFKDNKKKDDEIYHTGYEHGKQDLADAVKLRLDLFMATFENSYMTSAFEIAKQSIDDCLKTVVLTEDEINGI